METPPRTWGRLYICNYVSEYYRNTPTHVGKTWRKAAPSGGLTKHPHARGEDRGIIGDVDVDRETPPRTWGRQALPLWKEAKTRNTPTHVGKTRSGLLIADSAEKHPHARGEDFLAVKSFFFLLETPPRTWGRLMVHGLRPLVDRNTPTHVGKTLLAS